ncbi:MAG: hypothetical protein AAB267_01365, partial [Candidatus Desantisbacteria bacterium]
MAMKAVFLPPDSEQEGISPEQALRILEILIDNGIEDLYAYKKDWLTRVSAICKVLNMFRGVLPDNIFVGQKDAIYELLRTRYNISGQLRKFIIDNIDDETKPGASGLKADLAPISERIDSAVQRFEIADRNYNELKDKKKELAKKKQSLTAQQKIELMVLEAAYNSAKRNIERSGVTKGELEGLNAELANARSATPEKIGWHNIYLLFNLEATEKELMTLKGIYDEGGYLDILGLADTVTLTEAYSLISKTRIEALDFVIDSNNTLANVRELAKKLKDAINAEKIEVVTLGFIETKFAEDMKDETKKNIIFALCAGPTASRADIDSIITNVQELGKPENLGDEVKKYDISALSDAKLLPLFNLLKDTEGIETARIALSIEEQELPSYLANLMKEDPEEYEKERAKFISQTSGKPVKAMKLMNLIGEDNKPTNGITQALESLAESGLLPELPEKPKDDASDKQKDAYKKEVKAVCSEILAKLIRLIGKQDLKPDEIAERIRRAVKVYGILKNAGVPEEYARDIALDPDKAVRIENSAIIKCNYEILAVFLESDEGTGLLIASWFIDE